MNPFGFTDGGLKQGVGLWNFHIMRQYRPKYEFIRTLTLKEIPLYLNHDEAYFRFAAKRRLEGKSCSMKWFKESVV